MKIRVETTDRPIGFLLSGGLDSSLVVAIAKKFCPRLKTFSIGTSLDSPDIKAARVVSKFLDTDHTEIIFTIEEGLHALEEVIKSLESYDTTTVRASVPMWLLARWISQNTDCKVILSGEGSDELFGGYLYFHGAPNVTDFSTECCRRLRLIHQFDGLRADRCMAAHGLELRVPFLDKQVVEVGMTIDQALKVSEPEKRVIREQFIGLLPDEILWRQKNGMSDAVGYNWVRVPRGPPEFSLSVHHQTQVDAVKEYTAKMITDEEFVTIKSEALGHNVPQTKEEAFYRQMFWELFRHTSDHLISEIWRPRCDVLRTFPPTKVLTLFTPIADGLT